jgi:hypothetical protein
MTTLNNTKSPTDSAVEVIFKVFEKTFDGFYSGKELPKTDLVNKDDAKTFYFVGCSVAIFDMTRNKEEYYSILSDFIRALIKQGEITNPDFKNIALDCMNYVGSEMGNSEDSSKSMIDKFTIALGNWIQKRLYLKDSIEEKLSKLIGEKIYGQMFSFWIPQHRNILSGFVNNFEKNFLANLDAEFGKK